MKIQIKKALLEGYHAEKLVSTIKNDRNLQGAIAAPIAGTVLGGAIGNFIHGDGDMTPADALVQSGINPDQYNQRINDDEYDGTGALIGAAVGSAAIPSIRNRRGPLDRFSTSAMNMADDIALREKHNYWEK